MTDQGPPDGYSCCQVASTSGPFSSIRRPLAGLGSPPTPQDTRNVPLPPATASSSVVLPATSPRLSTPPIGAPAASTSRASNPAAERHATRPVVPAVAARTVGPLASEASTVTGVVTADRAVPVG